MRALALAVRMPLSIRLVSHQSHLLRTNQRIYTVCYTPVIHPPSEAQSHSKLTYQRIQYVRKYIDQCSSYTIDCYT